MTMRVKLLQAGLIMLSLAACSTVEPLETSLTTQSTPQQTQTDQSVIAEKVGQSTVGVEPLAWANPSTGSSGVIEEVGVAPDSDGACRTFTTTQRSLAGEARFKGVACLSGDTHWKVSPAR